MEKFAKILLIAASLLILVGIMRNYAITQYDRIILDKRNQATVIAHYIELNLDNRLTALAMVANDPDIRSLKPDKMADELKRTVNKLGFFNAVVFDRNGNFITEAIPEFHIGKVYDQDSFNKVLLGTPTISNRIVYNGLNTAYVSLRVPLFDENGQVKAVLVAGMPISQIADMVNKTMKKSLLGAEEYVFIIDNNLNYIAHPRLQELYLKEEDNAHGSFFQDNIDHSIEASVLDHTEKLYTFTNIEHANWRVVIATPLASLYGSMFKRSLNDLVIFTLLVIIIGLCYRVLKQRQAEKLALESLQMERLSCASQMAASIAHEVRNPLTSIKGFIQLIMRKPDRPAPPSYLEVIAAEIERIEKLVTEFQLLARPIKPAIFRPVNMVRVVKDVVMLMEGQAFNKKIELTFEDQLDNHLSAIFHTQGDQAQLKQVFINLLRNAIEAVDEAGRINVNLTLRDSMIAVTIKDNGMGMPQEVLLKLGTPFYTTKTNGTGLGLSVCFNIIESHGGKIEVTSQEGRETTFTVLLPYNPRITF